MLFTIKNAKKQDFSQLAKKAGKPYVVGTLQHLICEREHAAIPSLNFGIAGCIFSGLLLLSLPVNSR